MNRQNQLASAAALAVPPTQRGTRRAEPSPVDALAADGSCIRIRPAVPGDAAALVALHDAASERSRYLRFFTSDAHAGQRFVDQLFYDDLPPGYSSAHPGHPTGWGGRCLFISAPQGDGGR